MAATTTTRPAYQYSPLNSPRSIRILNLDVTTQGDDLSGTLDEEDVDDAPLFTALSYTWGEPIRTAAPPSSSHRHASHSQSHSQNESESKKSQAPSTDNPNPNPTITISHAHHLPITLNLHAALTQLKRSHVSSPSPGGSPTLRIWIDALCIDQRNNHEKSLQVAMMSAIYQHSHGLIWLGAHAENSAAAVSVLQLLHSLPESRYRVSSPDGSGKVTDWPIHGASLSDPETYLVRLGLERVVQRWEWEAVGRLLKRTWFSRVWTLQEFYLPEAIVFQVGDARLGFEHFQTLTIFAYAVFGGIIPEDSLLAEIGMAGSLAASSHGEGGGKGVERGGGEEEGGKGDVTGETMLLAAHLWFQLRWRMRDTEELIQPMYLVTKDARRRDASDARDHIYGILGMASLPAGPHRRKKRHEKQHEKQHTESTPPHHQPEKKNPPQPPPSNTIIVPDYDKPLEEVYLTFTTSYHAAGPDGAEFLLSSVEDATVRQNHNLPSWVPDYQAPDLPSAMRARASHGAFSAGGDSRGACSRILGNGRVLELEGVKVDEVVAVGESWAEAKGSGFVECLGLVAGLAGDGGGRWDAFWRTLICNLTGNGPAPPDETVFRPSFSAFLTLVLANALAGNQALAAPMEVVLSPLASQLEPTTSEPVLPAYAAIVSLSSHLAGSSHTPALAEVVALSRRYDTSLGCFFPSRRFFTTKSGHMGITSESVGVGDEVWVIRGHHHPSVCRRVGAQPASGDSVGEGERRSSRRKFIGVAYVHGIMHGEALKRRPAPEFGILELE